MKKKITLSIALLFVLGAALPVYAMNGMEGHFGVALTLTAAGTYKFVVGTKLADGKKRQYEFSADMMK